MDIRVNQRINANYYDEYLDQWIAFVSLKKRLQIRIAGFAILAGVIIYICKNEYLYIGYIISGIGVLLWYLFQKSNQNWITQQNREGLNGLQLEVTFQDTQIESNAIGILTENNKWDIIKKAIETEKGLFLILHTGEELYFQKTAFDTPNHISKIIDKVKAVNRK